ncbi:hypothetical protein EYF80_048006 [Liparis tanakae]|uniref:Heme-binding protein 1 n=1 Tax=Liparis tanakae TaxID=230148 RepID=A0A4Z2FL02_9TELE|nr:hypothetical protein EYF80_048006 [Liparis tanakae]
MDQGGCQMSGGGGGGGGGGGDGPEDSGMITLEDLESFSEEQLSDSGDEDKAMDDDRLLHYWQDVARGHQVEVAQAIFFEVYTQCGEVMWEKRQYEKGHWACVKMREETYEQSICYGFMKLMRYICQQNSLGDYLGMTLPIVTVVRTNEDHSVIANDVTYHRPFTGPTNELTIVNQINAMAEQLDSPSGIANDSFIVAGYTNPAHVNRQNEIWFLERP